MIKKILKIIFVLTLVLLTKGSVLASTGTIDATDHTAEFTNNNYGHINFLPSTGTAIQITDSAITGNAWGDYVGWINMAPTGSGVINDGNGNLSGYAWGQNTGWINFDPSTGGVSINSSGEFVGDAWAQNYGWIHFACPGAGTTCVKTDWEKSSSSGGGGTDYCPDIPGIQNSIALCPPPIDYCPNDPGIQNSVSECSVPPTDFCPDIPGIQTSPTDCPITVYDYCPNDPGIQNSISECSVPPTDFCPDIPGIQTSPTDCPITVYDYCPNDPGIQNSVSECSVPPTDFCPDIPGTQNSPEDCPSPLPDDDCYIINGQEPTLWQTINCMIEETIDHTGEVIDDMWNQIKYVFNNPDGNILTKTIAITGLAFGTAFTLLPYLFSTPFSFSELVLMPYRLWSLLMSILGLRKRVRPWGTVYDSVTKQPLDPVVVDLFDAEGKKVQTSITDMDGRYGFLTDPGHYWMRPRKTHYSFPSFKLAGKTRDEIYLDLYFGNFFEVKTGEEVITKNIPMDREHFDWNEFAKKDQKLMKFYSKRDIWLNRIADSLFSFGFFIAFIALVSSQSIYNIIIFVLYLIMLVIRETGIKQKMFGRVMTKDGAPLSYAVIKVYSTIGNIEVARKVANQYGKYYCIIQNGHYTVTIEQKNTDESYTLIYTSDAIEVKKGVINNHFKI